MEGKRPSSIKTKKGDIFPYDFFAALNRGDDDAALRHLRAEALPDGQAPSPRAEALIKSGEWDSHQKLSLVLIDSSACAGKIANDGYRFCGRPANTCKTSSHVKNTIGVLRRGWYISCVHKTQGVFTSPYLPAESDGGPIRSTGAGRLADAETPFRLTKGQWRFIIDLWYAANADDSSVLSSSGVKVDDNAPFDFSEFAKQMETELQDSMAQANLPELIQEDQSLSSKEQERVILLEKQVADLRIANRSIQADCAERLRAMEATIADKFRQLDEERSALMRSFRAFHERLQPLERNSSRSGSGDLNEAQLDKLEEIEHAVLGPNGAIASLRMQFSQFREKIESGGGIDCNGVVFSSKREFLTWFSNAQPPVEIFLDGLAFLHSIRSAVVYQDEASRQREAQLKTSMDSYLQVGVFTSFDTIIPSVFVGGKKMPDAGGSVFEWLRANLKTFEVWKPKGGQTHGVSHMILDGVN